MPLQGFVAHAEEVDQGPLGSDSGRVLWKGLGGSMVGGSLFLRLARGGFYPQGFRLDDEEVRGKASHVL